MTPINRRYLTERSDALKSEGKFAEALPLCEQALAIHRRLLTDDHPETAACYNNLASNLGSLEKTNRPRFSTRKHSRSTASSWAKTIPRPPSPTAAWACALTCRSTAAG